MKPLLIIFLAAHAAAPFAAFAQAKFPQRPVRILTVGAGSQNDIVARMPGPKLTDLWGQPVVVENRTGAEDAMTAATVAKGTWDGHTVLMLSHQFAIGAAVHANLPCDPIQDLKGATRIGISSVAVTVPPSLGEKSVA